MIRQDWSTLKKLMFAKTAAAGAAVTEDTVTGNPLTFQTDLARPLKSLLIPFTPQQSGTGNPSPQNIRPFLPWNGLTVFGGNSNLFKNENLKPNLYNLASDGTVTAVDPSQQSYAWTYGNSIFKTYLPAGKYTVIEETVIAPTQTGTGFNIKDENNEWLAERGYETFTLAQGKNVGLVCKTGDGAYRYSIVKGTAGEYEKQETTETDISFPYPVYGGTPDVVSGVLTVKWAVIALNGTEANWGNYNQGTAFSVPIIGMTTDNYKTVFCDRFAQIKNITSFGVYASASNDYAYFINATDIEGVTDLASWKAYLAENPMEFAYELATPQEIQLTPTQLTALLGNNTIRSDADGSMTAVYLVSSKYADEHPVGGLSSGLGSGLLGSNQDPDEPIEDPEENPKE